MLGNELDWTRVYKEPKGPKSYGQTSVTTTATQIFTPSGVKSDVIVKNHGSTDVYIGSNSSVTITNGILLGPQQSISFDDYSGYLWGIVQTTTVKVSYFLIGSE